jgi:3-methyladenine DNA glycosylase AlkD
VSAAALRDELVALADPERAAGAARYFQARPGGYGEGDAFLGVRVPDVRAAVRRHRDLGFDEIETLLDDGLHEVRLAGVLLLVVRARREPDEALARYLDALRRGRVDNWDLVDSSARDVLGAALRDGDRGVLDRLAASDLVWERRAAVIATFAFLADGDAATTLVLAERLLDDPHPLMHKAVGWALREVGARVDRAMLLAFLDAHAAAMPRVALSYATEHLDPAVRAHYRSLR